ncbi:precorrin-2 C(20)-methyltransferase [Pelotomaculum propionicicum]|uniref:Cobalt-precorrin-2 C(20)-methyltransferase n=1 Tax=Pelotomaculum propionicicum TaxID=258475 RepID=A0A4Y7RT73_9FIRM|nr:precorrin-2 C(20)-methyltransferase [Pelotomaculum propionicicum]NLI13022.1 precorrin-2 C(20)-methyltransferase [Peptococcaceae bacterium]TEB11929.1 Cobalt-precorrin-2 C(20)-methyltransferase [Pelotomaculum propionicicum]
MNKRGHLWGIGVGPGDPGLLTLKALEALKEATVIMAPLASSREESAALQIVKEWVDETRLRVYGFPMTREPDSLAACWREVADEVAALVEKGEKVVFLTLGDALTYSTFNYILQQLAGKIPPECVTTIPGVTSFAAAAAAENFPMVCGEELLAVIPLPDGPLSRVRGLVRESDTVVFMKIGNRLKELMAFVNEEFPDRAAVFASRVGTPGQYLCRDLDRLPEGVDGYLSVLIVRKAGIKP